MYYVKKAIYGPSPEEQRRKCMSLIRQNQRELDKQLNNMSSSENKTKTMIKSAVRRNDMKSARILAKELYGVRKNRQRLHKSRAQLNSVSLQVNEAFALRKLEGSMKSSTGLMKEVNGLIKLPELMGTMNSLSAELMKSGIIDEMVTDTLDNLDEEQFLDDEEAEGEVDQILDEILGNGKTSEKKNSNDALPDMPEIIPQEATAETVEDDSAMLDSMRERLKALQG